MGVEQNGEEPIIRREKREGRESNYEKLIESIVEGAVFTNLINAEMEAAGGLGSFIDQRLDRVVQDWKSKILKLDVLEGDERVFVEQLAREIQRRKG